MKVIQLVALLCVRARARARPRQPIGPPLVQPACQFAYDGDIQQLYSLVTRDPSGINTRDDVTGDTPLIAACRGARLNAITFLLERHADVRALNKVSRRLTSRLLHLVYLPAVTQSIDCFQTLVECRLIDYTRGAIKRDPLQTFTLTNLDFFFSRFSDMMDQTRI